jgi:putative ABC transport system ATP-binding protein
MTYGQGSAGVRALAGVNLRVPAGHYLCLLGPSGSGKSTLLHLLGGLLTPTGGRIWISDTEIQLLSEDERTDFRRQNVGLVFQFFNLVRELTVRQNVALPLLMDGVPLRHLRDRVDQLLERLSLLDRVTHRLDQLSGGEIQRVAIARALIVEPKVILADEPTGNLDMATSDEVFAVFRDVSDQSGVTIIVVTHDSAARAYADSVMVMQDGVILDPDEESGRPEDHPSVIR